MMACLKRMMGGAKMVVPKLHPPLWRLCKPHPLQHPRRVRPLSLRVAGEIPPQPLLFSLLRQTLHPLLPHKGSLTQTPGSTLG